MLPRRLTMSLSSPFFNDMVDKVVPPSWGLPREAKRARDRKEKYNRRQRSPPPPSRDNNSTRSKSKRSQGKCDLTYQLVLFKSYHGQITRDSLSYLRLCCPAKRTHSTSMRSQVKCNMTCQSVFQVPPLIDHSGFVLLPKAVPSGETPDKHAKVTKPTRRK